MLLLPSAGLPLAGSFRRSLWPSCQPRRFTVRPVRRDGSGGQERLCHRLGPSHRPREFCFVDGVIGLFHANISFFHIQLGSTTPLYNPRSCPICTSDKQSVPFGTHSSQPNTHVKIRSTKKARTIPHPSHISMPLLPSPLSKYLCHRHLLSSGPVRGYFPSTHAENALTRAAGSLLIYFPPSLLALSPSRLFLFFSLSLFPSPFNPASSQQTCALPTSLFGAVRRLAFSPDGSMLCGIGADRDNSLCVWSSASGDWTDGARVALGQGPRRAAMFVAWSAGGNSESSPYQVHHTYIPTLRGCAPKN